MQNNWEKRPENTTETTRSLSIIFVFVASKQKGICELISSTILTCMYNTTQHSSYIRRALYISFFFEEMERKFFDFFVINRKFQSNFPSWVLRTKIFHSKHTNFTQQNILIHIFIFFNYVFRNNISLLVEIK